MLPFQDLTVYLNGLWIGFIRAERPIALIARFPAAYLVHRENLLTFVMPNAACPREIGVGPDARRIGFAFQEIALGR